MTIKARIYRGEVRKALPTHTHPDPAEHLAADPHGFFKNWMSSHYPYPEQYRGMGPVTAGQHWTRSPETMPHRFALEPLTDPRNPQPGVPMGKREATAVGRREWLDLEHEHVPQYPRYSESESSDDFYAREKEYDVAKAEHHATVDKYGKYLERVEREGVNSYQDLSHPSPHPGAAKPFRMGVIWEAEHPREDEYEHGTNYEDELNLHKGVAARVTGARLYIPKSGTVPNTREQHPSTFTPEEHLAASFDVMHRSTYSHIGKTSPVPWNRIQFPEPINVPIEGRKYWSR